MPAGANTPGNTTQSLLQSRAFGAHARMRCPSAYLPGDYYIMVYRDPPLFIRVTVPLRRSIPFFIALVILVLFFTITARSDPQELDLWTIEHFQLARQAYQKNDLDVAAKEYRLVLSRNPKFAEGYLNLGIVYHQQKKYRESVTTLQTAIALKPDMLGAQVFLGIGEYMIQEFKGALVPLKKALELNPKERQAGIYLGLTFIALEKPEKAIRQLRKTARHFPEDLELSYHLGEAYTEAMRQSSLLLQQTGSKSALYFWAAAISAEQKDELLHAIEWYLKALAYDPNISELYLRVGLALKKSGMPELAAAALQRFGKLNPARDLGSLNPDRFGAARFRNDPAFLEYKRKFERLWEALPAIRVEVSMANVADELVNKALAKTLAVPKRSNIEAGLLLYSKGDYRAAAEKIRGSMGQDPKDWVSAYVLTRAYLLASDYESAQDILQELLLPYLDLPSVALLRVEISSQLALKYFGLVSSKQPDSFRARTLRAKYYAASNQTEGAIREYQEILKLAPETLGIHLALGNLYSDKFDWVSAIDAYRSELALSPENGLALSQLGHVYVENRDVDRAIEVLERLLQTHTTDAQAYADLGNAWRMKEDSMKAIGAYERALSLDGTLYDLHYRLFQLYKKAGDGNRAQMHLSKFKEGESEKRKKKTRSISGS